MHDTALENGRRFFDAYVKGAGKTIVEIGAQDVNGSMRSIAPNDCSYIGVDFIAAKGVDVVLDDPYSLPFPDGSIDVCVSSSCLEHSEFFWLSFLEMLRILRPSGILYLNVPSNGNYHRYPVDCWRFYPDSGQALANWARRSGMTTTLLESFTGRQRDDVWNDFIAVYVRDEAHADAYPHRMIDGFEDYTNGRVRGSEEIRHLTELMEDQEPHLRKRVRARLGQFLGRPH